MQRRETKYIKYITDQEFKRIRRWVERRIESPSMRMLIKLLLNTGMRISEVTNLKRSNFNQDFSKVTYELKKRKPTTTHTRSIPLKLAQELRKYNKSWHRRMKKNHLFFSSWRNQSKRLHLSEASIRDKFKHMRRELKITDIYYTCIDGKKLHRLSPHTTRHYIAWRIYKVTNHDLIAARDILGHLKAETTARYVRSIDVINNEAAIIEKAIAV